MTRLDIYRAVTLETASEREAAVDALVSREREATLDRERRYVAESMAARRYVFAEGDVCLCALADGAGTTYVLEVAGDEDSRAAYCDEVTAIRSVVLASKAGLSPMGLRHLAELERAATRRARAKVGGAEVTPSLSSRSRAGRCREL